MTEPKFRHLNIQLCQALVALSIVLLAGCVDTQPPRSGVSAPTATDLARSAGDISAQRTVAIARVVKAKEGFKSSAPKLRKATDLYVEAQKGFNSLLDQTLISVDTDLPIRESQDFKSKAEATSKALGAFVYYVDKETEMGMGVTEAKLAKDIVNGLLSGGAEIWKAYQDKKQAASAQQFAQMKELRQELKKTLESLRLPDFKKVE
jgi:hypothetical protein